jgi:hypothetical protein
MDLARVIETGWIVSRADAATPLTNQDAASGNFSGIVMIAGRMRNSQSAAVHIRTAVESPLYETPPWFTLYRPGILDPSTARSASAAGGRSLMG